MSVKTKIKVVLEIESDSTWPDECTIRQIKKQSLAGALEMLNKTLERGPGHITLVSAPECISIQFQEDK